jgi:C4-dicarboxylate-binding protein DctP
MNKNPFIVKVLSLPFLLIVLFLTGCTNDTVTVCSLESPCVIKFPHVTAASTPKGQAADRFKDLAEERFPGRVIVEVYPSSQLMNDDISLEALVAGEIQMIAVSLSKFDRLTQAFQIFDLPFLFPNIAAVESFQQSVAGKDLLNTLTNRGFQGLGFWHNGMKQFSAPIPLRVPQDASGLKFRIMESDVLQEQILTLGGSPQKMALGEVYQALQTGVVDAQENTWSNIYSAKYFEVQDYLMETNHGYIGYLVAVDPNFWGGLPEEIRVGLEEVMEEVTAWGNQRAEEINTIAREQIVASNRSELIAFTNEDLAVWQEAMRPVWEQFADGIGRDRIAAAQSVN